MKFKDASAFGVLLSLVTAAWLAPPPWPLGDPEAAYALRARELFLGRSGAVGEPVPVLGALLGLAVAGDSDFAVRLPGMLTGPTLVALAWGLSPELGRPRAIALGFLWGFSPVLALAGRTVGPATWVGLLTALGSFGLIRWAGTGRHAFFYLAVVSGAVLVGCGPAGWAALGGLGAAAAVSGRLAGHLWGPGTRPGRPALAAGVAGLALLLGAFGPLSLTENPHQPPLPGPVLLAVYEPLALGAWLVGLSEGRPGPPPDLPSVLGVVWPITALISLLLPVPAEPLAHLGPASLALGLGASGILGRVLTDFPRAVSGRVILGVGLLGAAGGFMVLTTLGALRTGFGPQIPAALALASATLGLAGLWVCRDPAGRRVLLPVGLAVLAVFSFHQFWRANYGLGPELIGPTRPGADLGFIVRTAEEIAGRPSARKGVEVGDAPPTLRWALRSLAEGPAPGLRLEPGTGDPGLGLVKIPTAYPEFDGAPAFLRWLLYREYDRLRTVDFVLKQGGS